MKIACERCEKVVDINNLTGWRRIVVLNPEKSNEGHLIHIAPLGFPSGNEYLLCDCCYDKLMDFIHLEN